MGVKESLKDGAELRERTSETEGRLEFEGDGDSERTSDFLEETEGEGEVKGEEEPARETVSESEALDDTEGDLLCRGDGVVEVDSEDEPLVEGEVKLAGLGVAPTGKEGVGLLDEVGASPDGDIVGGTENEGVAMVSEGEEEWVLPPPCDTLVDTVTEGGSTIEREGVKVGVPGVEVEEEEGLGSLVELAEVLALTLSLGEEEGESSAEREAMAEEDGGLEGTERPVRVTAEVLEPVRVVK